MTDCLRYRRRTYGTAFAKLADKSFEEDLRARVENAPDLSAGHHVPESIFWIGLHGSTVPRGHSAPPSYFRMAGYRKLSGDQDEWRGRVTWPALGLDNDRLSIEAVPAAGTASAWHHPLHGGLHVSTRSRSSSRRTATPPSFWCTWTCVAP